MISKGIPKKAISATSRGKEDSVTGNKCDHVKNRTALITCLSPDRRVEIEIQGTTEVITQPNA